MAQAHQSILQNAMAKKYRHISKTDQNTHQTDYRKDLISSKKSKIGAILVDFSPSRYERDERRQTPTKTPKAVRSWSNQFWNPIANVSVTLQYEKTSP